MKHLVVCLLSMLPLGGCGSAPLPPESSGPSLGAIADAEGERLVEEGAERVDILVMDMRGGGIVAEAHRGPRGPVPFASTIKPLTLAAAMRAGLDLNATFDGEGGRWHVASGLLEDWRPQETLSVADTITYSSNIGAAKIAEAVGVSEVASAFRELGMGESLTETDWTERGLHLASHGFEGEPRALAHAYWQVLQGRWLPPEETRALKAMLEDAVREGTGDAAQIDGLAVGGKTGTAAVGDRIGAWFVGAVPARDPELLVLVYAEVDEGYGGSVAAPAFRRVVLQACEQGYVPGCPAPERANSC